MTPRRHSTNVYARHIAHPKRAGALRRLVLVGLTSCALLCGCSSTQPDDETAEPEAQPEGPIAPGFEPIVIPNPNVRGGANDPLRDRRPVDDREAGWGEKLELASRYVQAGYDDAALQIINNALQQEPPQAWRTGCAS